MKKILGYIKNIFQRKDVTGLSILGHGHHFDWKILLSTFLLAVMSILFFNTRVFLGVKAGDIFQSQSNSNIAPVLINRDGLDQVIANFATRADNLKNLQVKKPSLVDPSL